MLARGGALPRKKNSGLVQAGQCGCRRWFALFESHPGTKCKTCPRSSEIRMLEKDLSAATAGAFPLSAGFSFTEFFTALPVAVRSLSITTLEGETDRSPSQMPWVYLRLLVTIWRESSPRCSLGSWSLSLFTISKIAAKGNSGNDAAELFTLCDAGCRRDCMTGACFSDGLETK